MCIIFFSSCAKKKYDDAAAARQPATFQPPTEIQTDTAGVYISPTDFLRDNSQFDQISFQSSTVKYFGNRTISYNITPWLLQNGNDTLKLVVEYLYGKVERAGSDGKKIIDDTRTATRLLFYLNNALSFRKAFPVTIYDSRYFASTRTFEKTFFNASPTKTIVYFWTDETGYGEQYEKLNQREYQAVGVDKDGIIYDLTGYFHHVSDNLDAVRFLSENRVSASVAPNPRYRNLAIDIIISIDWKTSSTSLEIPPDSIFPITNTPDRFFGSKTKLYSESIGSTVFKELPLRKSTRAQMVKMFAPSLFNAESIVRDRVFVQFTNANKGWVDYTAMVSEEIIAEEQ